MCVFWGEKAIISDTYLEYSLDLLLQEQLMKQQPQEVCLPMGNSPCGFTYTICLQVERE